MEISNLHNENVTELRRRIDKHNDNFNKVRKYKEEPDPLKNTIIDIKYTLEGIKSRLDSAVY